MIEIDFVIEDDLQAHTIVCVKNGVEYYLHAMITSPDAKHRTYWWTRYVEDAHKYGLKHAAQFLSQVNRPYLDIKMVDVNSAVAP